MPCVLYMLSAPGPRHTVNITENSSSTRVIKVDPRCIHPWSDFAELAEAVPIDFGLGLHLPQYSVVYASSDVSGDLTHMHRPA